MNKYALRLPSFLILLLINFTSFLLHSQNEINQLNIDQRNNVALLREKIYLHTDKPYYSAGEKIWFKAYLVNAITHLPESQSRFVYAELVDKRDSVITRVKVLNDSVFGFNGHLLLNPKIKTGHYELRAYTHWMLNYSKDFIFRKKIFIGNLNDNTLLNYNESTTNEEEYDFQFFPESGSFLANQIQTIAFKAIGSDGLSVKTTGTVFNKDDVKICDFESINNGMGKFSFLTQSGMTYYAVVNSEKGTQKKFNLPELQDEGVALKLIFNRNSEILYEVINNHVSIDSLLLIAHVRGNYLFSIPLDSPVGKISESSLPEGIITFSVISTNGIFYCERLFFSRNFKTPLTVLEKNKTIYKNRDSVSLKFDIQSYLEKPFDGNFSLSITDNLLVKNDSLAENIKSYLLFTSDLKGNIETPGVYFLDNSIMTREKTDILMMTQGWRKYHSPEFIEKGITPEYFIEKGQYLTGKVLNLMNRPAKQIDVVALNPSDSTYFVTQTDSLGRYLIEGISIKDSTDVFVRAFSRNRFIDVEIVPDEEIHPVIPNQIFAKEDEHPFNEDYFDVVKQKFRSEGMLDIILGELTVEARRRDVAETTIYTSLADNVITASTIENLLGSNIQSLLLTLPGVMPSGNSVSIRGQGEPLFLLNGMQVEYDEISYLSTIDIQEIALIKGAGTTFLGPRALNGAIAVTLKKGTIARKAPLVSMARVRPLGFQQVEEFYVPKYDAESRYTQTMPDLRTTIYWNPKLTTNSEGKFEVQFYTADSPNDYLITLEGISKEGEICRFSDLLKREE